MSFIPKPKNKTLKEFLVELIALNMANIEFLRSGQSDYKMDLRYKEEIMKIQDLINSFEFEE